MRTLINNPVRIRPRLLRELSGYDTVLVDCAGNLHDTPLLAEVLAVADFAVIPFVPERAADARAMFEGAGVPYLQLPLTAYRGDASWRKAPEVPVRSRAPMDRAVCFPGR